eukprot:TRINITY_DN21045_c0_g1_i1.p1 TRINITY_DN21045_c0_g1~~TRINITY_DN21045_c0_g1_i1.p1  ORF type:complete len:423 (+),score=63.39 TRINITY_DN21045_c0_g1_i1:51-1271(+)
MKIEKHHVMLAYCWLASVICYVDRTNMSVAMVPAAEHYGWDKATQGFIFSGFFMGYATTQVLGGVLAGMKGGPYVLLCAVAIWSFWTLITPLCAHNLWLLMLARIGLGAGEGIAMPSLHAIASAWYPPASLTKYVSFITSGHQLGIVISLILAPVAAANWEIMFYLFGVIGFVWSGCFLFNPPEGGLEFHPVKQRVVPWRVLCTKKEFWAIYLSHFGGNFGFYILITWLPVYFTHLGVPLEEVGGFTIPAYICAAVSANVAGHACDSAIQQGYDVLTVRKCAQGIAMGGGAISLLVCALLPTEYAVPKVMALLFCGALASHGCHTSGNMVNILDIAPEYAGEVHGISNTIATLAGVVGNIYVGYVLPVYGWPTVFLTAVTVYVTTLCFFVSWASSTPQFRLNSLTK